MNKNRLKHLSDTKQWDLLINEFSVDEVCRLLDYKESMALAYDLFSKNFMSFDSQDFAVRLLFAIKKMHFHEWDLDWKNDVFLANLCSLTYREEAIYQLYKGAYNSLIDPPDSLLLLLAACNSMPPGIPEISDEESEAYLKRAIAKKITFEGAIRMRALARKKNDKEQENYWDYMMSELKNKNIHTEAIIPDVLLAQGRN